MHEQKIYLINEDKCLPPFFPVCRDLIENVIKNDQHTYCSKLFSQLQNIVADQSVIHVYIGLFGKSIQRSSRKKLKFKSFFRVAIFLPCVTSLVSYSLIMKAIFANQGMFNSVMMDWGVLDSPIMWVTDQFWAKVLIIISITWRWIGYNMVFYLAGLQNIEPSVYEAADIDGAGPIKRFFTITIPLLKPIILFTTITSTIGTLQLFDEVQNITQGGPANGTVTISQYIYNLCFKFTPNFGYACAVAFVVVVLIVLLSLIQFRLARDKD